MNEEWTSEAHPSGLGAPGNFKLHEMLSLRGINRALHLTFRRLVSEKDSIPIVREFPIFDLFENSVSKRIIRQKYLVG